MKKASAVLTIISILSINICIAAARDVSIRCDRPEGILHLRDSHRCQLIGVKSRTEKLRISSINVNFKEQAALTGRAYSVAISGNENYPEHMPEELGIKIDGIKGFFYYYSPLKYIKRSDFVDMGSELISLGLYGNQIEDIPYDTFCDLPKIKTLILSDNKLKKFEPATFANLPQMKNLRIENNQIMELHPDLLKNLPNLDYFDAKKNQIEELSEDFFINNQKLTIISLNNNKLKNILVDFRRLKELRYVYLIDNHGTCDFVYFTEDDSVSDCEYSSEDDSEDPKGTPRDCVYDINEFQDKVEKNCKHS